MLQRVVEIGILNHLYELSSWEISMKLIRHIKAVQIKEKEIHLVGMKEMESLFIYYTVLMTISTTVFVCEILLDRIQRVRKRKQRKRNLDSRNYWQCVIIAMRKLARVICRLCER